MTAPGGDNVRVHYQEELEHVEARALEQLAVQREIEALRAA